jgi:periplasmic protein TonB
MVLARAPSPLSFGSPKPSRITGLSIALLIHAAALLLLSLPGEIVVAPQLPPAEPMVAIPIMPVTPVKTFEVPDLPVPPQRQRQVATAPVQDARPVVDIAAIPLPVEQAPAFEPGPGERFEVSLPPAPAQVALRFAPPPPYPKPALRAGNEGTVTLRVLVGVDGSPRRVEVEQSSGYRALDRAAADQVLQRWRFAPATRGGQAVEAWALIPIDFHIPR